MKRQPANPQGSVAQDIDELRAATRAAHEVLKDLRAMRRDLEVYLTAARLEIAKQIDGQINTILLDYMTRHQAAFEDSIAMARDHIIQRFSKLQEELLGETPSERARLGGLSIPEFIARARLQ